MAREFFQHDQLFAGEVGHIAKVWVNNLTCRRGEILVDEGDDFTFKGGEFASSNLGTCNVAVVSAEDLEDYTGEAVVYTDGYFNASKVYLGGNSLGDISLDSQRYIRLMRNKIFLVKTMNRDAIEYPEN